jgi:hypothetical protein
MKNLILFGFIACFLLSNCSGPSAEELKKQPQMDSIKKADEIAKIEAEAKRLADQSNQKEELAKDVKLNTKTPSDKKLIKTAELKFKVKNVHYSTEKIEDLTAKYGGYVTYSNLQNQQERYNSTRISRDSIMISKQIVVINDMQLRVPNARLDSFVRELNPLVVFLDYRVIKMSDVTLQFLANQKRSERLQKYEQRQKQHIDNKDSKLKETTNAEDNLLNRQNEADDLLLNSMSLEDQLKYCNISMNIYQKPLIVKEVIANFEYVSDKKPNFFVRIWDSIVKGWWILEELIMFLTQIWGVVLLIVGIVFGIKYLSGLYKRLNKSKVSSDKK